MTDSVAATMSRVRSRDDMSKVAEKDVISSSPHDKDKAATGGGAVLHSHNDAAHVVPLKVRVLLGPEDSNHQFYEIRLTLPHGKSWSVNRRYSEFLVLFHELEHMQGEEEKKAFPPRHPFASSTNTSVVHERVEKLPAWLCAISQNQTLSTQPQFRAFLGLDKIEPLLEAEVKTLTGGENSGPLLPLESTTVMPGEGHVGPASPHTPPLKAAAASEVSQPQSPNTNGMRFRDIMPAIPRAPVVRPHHHITTEAKQQQQHAAEDMAHAEVTVALPSFVSLNAKSELDSARQLEERAKSLSSVARREATEATALLARADKEKAAREEIKANLKRIRGDAELGTKSEKELLLAAAALDQQQTYVREKASRIEAKVADLNREASSSSAAVELLGQMEKEIEQRAREIGTRSEKHSLEAKITSQIAVGLLQDAASEEAVQIINNLHRQFAAAAAAKARVRLSCREASAAKSIQEANILLEQEKRIEQRVLAVRVLQARSRLHATRRQLTDLEKRIAEMRTKSEKATQDAAEAAAELDAHMNAMNRLSSFLARIKTAAIFPPKSPSLVVQGVGAVSTKVESGRVTQAPGVKSSESAY